MSVKFTRRAVLKSSLAAAAVLSATSVATSAENAVAASDTGGYMNGVTKTQNWCEMCFWNCGVTVLSRNGRVFKLEGQKKCPNNYGSLCARGNSGIFQMYDPDRLRYPLIRTGERGSGQFRKATWEEATTYVADNLRKVLEKYGGGQSIAALAHGSGQGAFVSLMGMMGAKNIGIPSYSQCLGSREVGWYATYGAVFTGRESHDAARSKAVMLLGRNALEAVQVGEAKRIISGMENGGKLIYVDPRYTKTSAKADYWLKIRPGTDMALTIGMIAYMIQNDLYDKNFINHYTHGIGELKKAYQSVSLEWASHETGIPVKSIVEVINILVKAAPHCFIHPGRRVSRYGDDTQMTRTIAILNALLGNWQQPGGITTMSGPGVRIPPMVEYSEHDTDYERADGAGDVYPLSPPNLGLVNQIINAVITQKPYPIKALIAFGVNPFQHASGYDAIKEMISKLDLVVTSDIYLNEIALYSDVILPESTYLERADPISGTTFMNPFIQYREQASKPLGDTIGAWEMVRMISDKMGYKTKWRTIDEVNQTVVERLGISIDLLKEDGVYVRDDLLPNAFGLSNGTEPEFNTYSGHIELYSDLLDYHGFDPVPVYTKHPQPAEDELRLLFGRLSFHTHARTHNIRPLLALQDYKVEAWIPKGKAEKWGIQNGDMIRIAKGDKKSGPMTAKVTDKIEDSAIFIPHGFGRISPFMKSAFAMKGASDADFASNVTDPVSGAAGFHMAFVKVEKVR